MTIFKYIRRWWIKEVACEKDVDKVCPHLNAIKIVDAGVMKADIVARIRCCKFEEQMKQNKGTKQ